MRLQQSKISFAALHDIFKQKNYCCFLKLILIPTKFTVRHRNLHQPRPIRGNDNNHPVLDRLVGCSLSHRRNSKFLYIWKITIQIFQGFENKNLLCVSSANDINFITIDDCTMISANWLQIIQFTPSSVVITSDCGDIWTIKTANEYCSLACRYCTISRNAKIYLKYHKNMSSIRELWN